MPKIQCLGSFAEQAVCFPLKEHDREASLSLATVIIYLSTAVEKENVLTKSQMLCQYRRELRYELFALKCKDLTFEEC